MVAPRLSLATFLNHDPIVVTGMGVVSAAGHGPDALWLALSNRSPLAQPLDFSLTGPHPLPLLGCPAPPTNWRSHPWSATMRKLDNSARWALEAAHMAVSMANLPPDPTRTGVITGSSRGPVHKSTEAANLLLANLPLRPTMGPATTLAAPTGAITHALNARGPSWSVSAACASGAFAIAAAAEQIALGNADAMIAGGSDDALHPLVTASLSAAGVLSHSACRPFLPDRNGLIPGAGAAMLVLESLSSATRRGATPLATLRGWSLLSAPEGMASIHPDGEGLQRAIQAALRTANLPASAIGLVLAHGTGTSANDAAEAAALRATFPSPPPLVASKPITGHCLGATPVMEAILAIESLRRNLRPPSPLQGPSAPDCQGGLLSPGNPFPPDQPLALSLAAAFWGFHAALLFSR
jgi:3-oxoacyl-[acyl-carrier-protein] synthase II